jgi:hypothetical protein
LGILLEPPRNNFPLFGASLVLSTTHFISFCVTGTGTGPGPGPVPAGPAAAAAALTEDVDGVINEVELVFSSFKLVIDRRLGV